MAKSIPRDISLGETACSAAALVGVEVRVGKGSSATGGEVGFATKPASCGSLAVLLLLSDVAAGGGVVMGVVCCAAGCWMARDCWRVWICAS